MSNKDIYILGIESSCDDTSAAILKNGIVNSNIIAFSKSILSVTIRASKWTACSPNEYCRSTRIFSFTLNRIKNFQNLQNLTSFEVCIQERQF